jgi:hypothetical protein
MIEWFQSGGVMMWPVLLAGLIAVGLAVDAWRRLSSRELTGVASRRVRGRIDAVLFWGVLAVLMGLIGTLVGVSLVAGSASRAMGAGRELPAEVIWDGLRVTLPPVLLGLMVLAAAMGLWFGLRSVFRKKVAAAGA